MRPRAGLLLLLLVVLAVPAPAAAQDTPPEITLTLTGPQGDDGWFVGDVLVNWAVSDPDDGFTVDEGCEPAATITDDTSGTESVCRATSNGPFPVQSSQAVTIRRDATPPSAGAAPSRGPDVNGWYNRPFDVGWSGADGMSGIASCTRRTYAGPDTAAGSLSGSCRDRAGNTSAAAGFVFSYDATPPVVAGAVPERAPAESGWFTSPVRLLWNGSDATSGVSECTALRLDASTAGGPPSGSCVDRAGNQAARVPVTIRYDDRAPLLAGVRAVRNGTQARVTWDVTGAERASVTRFPGREGSPSSVVYSGPSSAFTDRGLSRRRRYRYVVVVLDAAGNSAQSAAQLRTSAQGRYLLAPDHGAELVSPPALRWRKVRGARFYNVQLFRGDRKILTRWPSRTRLQLQRTWRYGGKTERLEPGVYRWYLWAAHGTRRTPRYGRLLGGRSFRVAER